jgi:D-proline reductase (dithiol) PrdB
MFLDDMPEPQRSNLLDHPMPDLGETPCVGGPPLGRRRIALVTTAALHGFRDPPFVPGRAEYRVIPDDMDMSALVTSHVSTNIDRIGILSDIDTVFPIHRLHELVAAGAVGATAPRHYSFMGATPPMAYAELIAEVADAMKRDRVEGIVLAPV